MHNEFATVNGIHFCVRNQMLALNHEITYAHGVKHLEIDLLHHGIEVFRGKE